MTECPDLRPFFRHAISRPMQHSFGVSVLSDWADKGANDPVFGVFKQCGWWTQAEGAILYAAAFTLGGRWLDIGGHTGWTTAHLIAAGCEVDALDPMYHNDEFHERALDNLKQVPGMAPRLHFHTSDQFFSAFADQSPPLSFSGVVIDGDHKRPHPLRDAQNAAKHLRTPGCIMLHDASKAAVQDAVKWLIDAAFECRVYLTPHVVACCWRGDFRPPEYPPDPAVVSLEGRLPAWMRECVGR